MVCFLGLVGCENKNSAAAVANIQIINKTINDMVITNSTSVTSNKILSQTLNIEYRGDMNNCPVDFSQKMNIDSNLKVYRASTNLIDFKKKISDALISANTSGNNQESQFMQTSNNNNSDVLASP